MSKKIVGWVVVFFLFLLMTLAINWYWIKNDSTVQGFIFGIIGVIIGGLVSGYGSILGGIHGANQNYKLNEEAQSAHMRKLFIAQLKFTYKRLSPIMSMKDINEEISKPEYVSVNFIVYDNNWCTYFPYIKELTSEEIETIVNWFATIDDIERTKNNFGLEAVQSIKVKISDQLSKIKTIIDKIE